MINASQIDDCNGEEMEGMFCFLYIFKVILDFSYDDLLFIVHRFRYNRPTYFISLFNLLDGQGI